MRYIQPPAFSVAHLLQVELRVMAALSGDDALLQAFAAGQDVHAATAREVLGKGPEVRGHLSVCGLLVAPRHSVGCACPLSAGLAIVKQL